MDDHSKVLEIIRSKDQAPLGLDVDASALLIVDAQRYFARPEYPFGQTFERLVPGSTSGYFERVRATVLPNIKRLQDAFRSSGRPVVFCVAGSYTDDGSDMPGWLRGFDQLSRAIVGERSIPKIGDPSWEIDDDISPEPGEIVLNKTSSGPLATTKLDQILRNMGISSLVVCGLTTAVCVSQTARETADRGFNVIIAEDASTEMSKDLHRAAIETFSLTSGRVRNTNAIIQLYSTFQAAA
jgi:biuret amidohydrolase